VKNHAAESVVPVIGLIMGSDSDWKTMRHTADTLDSLGISYEKMVVSAHRTPDDLVRYAKTAASRGLALIIAGAGGAAHLPGMTAAMTLVPVIGVPMVATPLNGLDALLSIMQMPAEIGVATVAVGEKGARHAALFAATIFARADDQLSARLLRERSDMLKDTQLPSKSAGRGLAPKVFILIERESDLQIMQHAETTLANLELHFTLRIVGAGIPAERLREDVRRAEDEGAAAFIAGSSGGIDLACRIARTTMLPVLGVPIVSEPIEYVDRFLQPFLEMPSGIATFAIGRAGAINAALFVATILSPTISKVRSRLQERRDEQVRRVREMKI
jgi:5-(carboxyamino)imidazole ribonucleotide mutase